MDLPRIHPREEIVSKAKHACTEALYKILDEHDLTTGEALKVVATVANSWIQDLAKRAIRKERHGDEDKPGGWA